MSNIAIRPPSAGNGQVRTVLVPRTFDQLVRFSEMAASSDLMPTGYKGKPGNVMIAVQMGSELGLPPMQALNSIAVINGRPGVWGDGLIGICRQSPLCEDIQESFEGEGDSLQAVCVAKRRNSSPSTARFSVADAKKAALWGKAGPWQQYPKRMLQNRARGFALRDAFPDLLRGLKTVEELRDYPEEVDGAMPARSHFDGVSEDVSDQAALPAPATGDKLAALEQALDLPNPLAELEERAAPQEQITPEPSRSNASRAKTAPEEITPSEADVRWVNAKCLFLRTATVQQLNKLLADGRITEDRADLRHNHRALSDQLETGIELARKRLHAAADERETSIFGGPVT